jgi:hypothetical protein
MNGKHELTWLEKAVVLGGVALAAAALLRIHGAIRVAPSQERPEGFLRHAASAADQLKRSVALAGTSGMDGLRKAEGRETDTLTVYTNENEGKTTLLSAALAGDSTLHVMGNAVFPTDGFIAIRDGRNGEYVRVRAVRAEGAGNTSILLCAPLAHPYAAAAAEVFPAHQEIFFVDSRNGCLMHSIDGRTGVMAWDMREFRVQLRDQYGAVTASRPNAKAVTFSIAGKDASASGTSRQLSLTSTAIARNGR